MPPSHPPKLFANSLPVGPLRLLNNPNYLKYFGGQLISLSGSWMQSVAQSWLVYRLSDSGYWLGMLTFCTQLPAFFMSPIAGVVADQFDRKKVLLLAQVIEMVQALVLAALVFSGTVQLWHVVSLAVLLGVVSAFDMTTRHAFAVDLVGKSELSNAIALNSVLINATRVLGPMLAGFLLALVGEAWCFLINGLSYLPVIAGLATMNIVQRKMGRNDKSIVSNVVEGVHYAKRSPLIFRLLLLSALVCLIACPYVALLPIFAKNVLGGGGDTLAWLTGMLGLGAVVSALLFTGSNDAQVIKRRLIGDVLFWGLGLITLGLSKSLPLSLGAMFMIGYFMMSFFPTVNNTIQQAVDDSMRGRVMSLYTMTFLGTMPFGGLLMGWLSEKLSAPAVVAYAGLLTVVMGFALALRNTLRYRLRIVTEGIRSN